MSVVVTRSTSCVKQKNPVLISAFVTARRKFEALMPSTYPCYRCQSSIRSSRVISIQQASSMRLIHGHSFSLQKAEKDLDAISKTDKISKSSEPSPTKGTKTSEKIWAHSKQFSASILDTVRDSAIGAMAWTRGKVSAFTERSKDRISENIQSSVQSTKSIIKSRAQGFQDRMYSSMRSSVDSLFQSVIGPIRRFGNYIANLWQTTPIWNRFFWWSLSAIAVYGMATTVPKEIVKYAIFSTSAVENPSKVANKAKKSADVESDFASEN